MELRVSLALVMFAVSAATFSLALASPQTSRLSYVSDSNGTRPAAGALRLRKLLQATIKEPCSGFNTESGIGANLDLQGGCLFPSSDQCSLPLIVTVPVGCTGVSAPYPVIVLFQGYGVTGSQFYDTIVQAYARQGYAVIQYVRADLNTFNKIEVTYIDTILNWRIVANNTAGSAYHGQFGTDLGVMGHSMGGGLAAVAAGTHATQVSGVVLLDPVDYTTATPFSIAHEGVRAFGRPVAVVLSGIRCVDQAGCHAPTSSKMDIGGITASGCVPSWWCCDFDPWGSSYPLARGCSPDPLTASGTWLTHGGAESFAAVAPAGSWVVDLHQAGHMSFLDGDPVSDSQLIIQCPTVVPATTILPLTVRVAVAWMNLAMRGLPATDFLQWAADPALAPQLSLSRLKSDGDGP